MTVARQRNQPKVASQLDIVELRPGIYQFPGEKPGSHVYLIRGSDKNVLIDTGVASNFPYITRCLRELGLKARDIHFVILTHEHPDHIGATVFFSNTTVVGAHRLAANKIELQDEFVTMNKYVNAPTEHFYAHLWLEDNTLIDLGNYKLRVIHTPGHTSGCICIYELTQRLLFSGDTVFSGGTLSDIATSGNISDYVNSLERLSTLKITELYPAHGRVSLTPEQDMKQAVVYARTLMEDTKALFEAITQKEGMPSLQALFKGSKAKGVNKVSK